MTIKKVRIADAEILRALAERTFREAWQHMNDPEAFEQYCREHFSPENIAAELAAPAAEFYFAVENGTPLAYLKLNLDCKPESPGDSGSPPGDFVGKALQLERIYVLRDIQSRGLGAELLHFAEQRARETGATWVWLSVWQKSPRTIQFYERNGYAIFGVETFWVGDDPQLDWLMRKKIAD